jgi:spermidine synthase
LVSRRAEDWGRDVGRYAALNTLGSCLGVLGFTLVGLDAPLWHGAVALALGMGSVATVEGLTGRAQWAAAAVGAAGLAVLVVGLSTPVTTLHGATQWWGRDGVVEVHPEGNVYIDGLWHTKLTDGRDHVGRPYSWLMAVAAVVAHEDPPSTALVIGAGVGITSATLAGVPDLQIDGYEINRTLRRVLEALPDRTLDALNQPQIRWIWDDARTGLALSENTYDLILSAPLHLRQAGSSQLLSQEYLRLVKSRLNEGGVLAVYANEGEPAQALLVQRTLADAFEHRVSWYDGLVTVASDEPIVVTDALLERWMRRDGQLASEMRRLDAERHAAGLGGLFSLYDGPQALSEVASRPITDDWPMLEYPQLAERWVEAVPVESLRR